MDRPTGIGVYGAQCLERLLDAGHEVLAYSFGGRVPGPALSRLAPRLRKLVHHPVPMRVMRRLWRAGLGLEPESLFGSIDVVFATETTLPRTEAPTVSVLHDALFLRHPEWFPRYVRVAGPENLRDVEARATLLVHSSETARDVIASEIPGVRPRAVVVPPAVYVEPFWRPGGSDILFVGTREPRKGLGVVARALLRLPIASRLVVVGKPGWGSLPGGDALSLLEEQGRLAIEGFVSPTRLRRLRETCAVAVVPSLDEGFGLPLLEALASGIPTVASDVPVFREVAGDACAFAAPGAPDDWAAVLEPLLSAPARLKALAADGIERGASFTVERQAAALDAALRRARLGS